MADATPSTQCKSPLARLAFPNLFELKVPRQSSDGKSKCWATLIFDPAAQKTAEYAAMKTAAAAAARKKWGSAMPKTLKSPFIKVESLDKKHAGFEDGCVIVRATSTRVPGIVDRKARLITDERAVYAGCYVFASLNAFTYDTSGNKGVSFGLNNLQKVKDGEPLGGFVPADKDFQPLDAADGEAEEADALFGEDDKPAGRKGGTQDVEDNEIPF